jgi:predicted nuclease of predicted toxin-antitoxin system
LKIKVDEDLPKRVAEAIRGVVPNTLTVVDEGLSGILDPALWETVQREQRYLITGDKAFANIKKYPPGSHAGILLLRPHEDGIPQLMDLIQEVLKLGILESLGGCIAIATPGRLRVRRPG